MLTDLIEIGVQCLG